MTLKLNLSNYTHEKPLSHWCCPNLKWNSHRVMAISFFGKYSSGRGPRKEKKTIHSQCAPLLSAGGWAFNTNFKNGGGLTRSQLLEGVCWERGGNFFQGGCNFDIKNKLKSEIFNDKKSLQAKIFFSAITKNSNWEILPKNLVTFKR